MGAGFEQWLHRKLLLQISVSAYAHLKKCAIKNGAYRASGELGTALKQHTHKRNPAHFHRVRLVSPCVAMRRLLCLLCVGIVFAGVNVAGCEPGAPARWGARALRARVEVYERRLLAILNSTMPLSPQHTTHNLPFF